jgi:hypothetical protein
MPNLVEIGPGFQKRMYFNHWRSEELRSAHGLIPRSKRQSRLLFALINKSKKACSNRL